MWSRQIFKTRAKNVLSKTYWVSFGLCFVANLLIGIVNSGQSTVRYVERLQKMPDSLLNGRYYNDYSSIVNSYFSASAFQGAFSALFLIGIVYMIFVGLPIEVGKNRFFLENRKGLTDFGDLFYSFKSGSYIEIVKSMAWRYLFTFLWTLLFIIPGIVKYYSYILTPYIVADNPNIGYQRALRLSMDMTRGRKWDIFVLQLSFIGWALLSLLACCGLGFIFLAPYYEATMVEMYGTLRKNAVEKGIVSAAELNLSQQDYDADSWGFQQY